MNKEKNTRLFYTDEQSVSTWRDLSPEQCKEVLLKCLTYQYGEDIKESDFSSQSTYLMFKNVFKPKIDYNEEKWLKQAEKNRNNGKESMGRPRKVIFASVPRNPTGKIEKPKLREKYCGDSLVASQIKG
jgi:hypothetical protein